MTWEVRAVSNDGTLVSVIDGVTVQTVHHGINGDQYADLSTPTLHADATLFDLFSHEVQLWMDGSLYFWGRPARLDASREGTTDTLTVRCDGLFSYFFDEFVGGEKENHIVSPHLDASAVGVAPVSWIPTSGVDQVAVVDNNWEFWHAQKAIQVNNADTDGDDYIYQRYTVPAGNDAGLPFAAAATCYISDNEGGSPAWGGPAYNERGLMIHRLDGTTFAPLSSPKVAKITDETPRNALVRLQTDEVVAYTGEVIEVRLYAPDAWVAWRWAGLFDGRWEGTDRADKSAAVQTLVEHAQDTTIGKQDHNIGTDLVTLNEAANKTWPWWRRDNIGEQIVDLADTFEFTIDIPTTTPGAAVRNVKVRRTVGTDRSATVTLTKVDFVAWGLASELASSYSRVIRQGDGQGIARDEWWEDDPLLLGGAIRERLDFGAPGETLAMLRDAAQTELDRAGNIDRLPRARIVGDLAKTIREGDTVAVDLDHGWAQFTGDARVISFDLDGASLNATVNLEPVIP